MADTDESPGVWIPDAFDAFYEREYAAVLALAYAVTGRAGAEDLAQEAFLRAFRDWSAVSAMESPSGWVRRVVLNLARSRLRRLQVEAGARLRLIKPSTLVTQEVADEAFWDEVRRLPARQSQVLALRYIEDLSIRQISDVLGIAEGSVKASLHQGRERLKRQLQAKGVLDET